MWGWERKRSCSCNLLHTSLQSLQFLFLPLSELDQQSSQPEVGTWSVESARGKENWLPRIIMGLVLSLHGQTPSASTIAPSIAFILNLDSTVGDFNEETPVSRNSSSWTCCWNMLSSDCRLLGDGWAYQLVFSLQRFYNFVVFHHPSGTCQASCCPCSWLSLLQRLESTREAGCPHMWWMSEPSWLGLVCFAQSTWSSGHPQSPGPWTVESHQTGKHPLRRSPWQWELRASNIIRWGVKSRWICTNSVVMSLWGSSSLKSLWLFVKHNGPRLLSSVYVSVIRYLLVLGAPSAAL